MGGGFRPAHRGHPGQRRGHCGAPGARTAAGVGNSPPDHGRKGQCEGRCRAFLRLAQPKAGRGVGGALSTARDHIEKEKTPGAREQMHPEGGRARICPTYPFPSASHSPWRGAETGALSAAKSHPARLGNGQTNSHSHCGRSSAWREAPVTRLRREDVRACGALEFTQGKAWSPHAAASWLCADGVEAQRGGGG